MTLYERGEFEASLREFQRGYDVCRLPPLLVNITKLYLKLGQKAEARQAFDLYQRMDPEPSEGIRAEIKALREQLAEAPPSAPVIATEPEPPEPPPPPEPPLPKVKPPESAGLQRQPLLAVAPTRKSAARSKPSRWWLWSALGAVTVGAAVGIGVGVSRADRPPDSALGPVVIFR